VIWVPFLSGSCRIDGTTSSTGSTGMAVLRYMYRLESPVSRPRRYAYATNIQATVRVHTRGGFQSVPSTPSSQQQPFDPYERMTRTLWLRSSPLCCKDAFNRCFSYIDRPRQDPALKMQEHGSRYFYRLTPYFAALHLVAKSTLTFRSSRLHWYLLDLFDPSLIRRRRRS
jgi:hypothetical protein